jgi:RimJ/RimL family protein N-acetyltransferase
VRLEGEWVVLRPFRRGELDAWWAARLNAYAEQPGGPPTRDALRARVERSGHLENGRLDLAIEAGGLLVGEIGTYRPPARTLPPRWFEIGVGLFEEPSRGKGYGTEALVLLAHWLVDQAGATRLQAATTPDNSSMRRVLEKLGFVSERSVKESGTDFVLYTITPGRWRPPG